MNARGKTVDKTFLSLDMAEERGFIHRDYIAHCLRWSHVLKLLAKSKAYSSAMLLDVGCGRELPLAKLLYSSRFIVQNYFGVDVGPILDTAIAKVGGGKFPIDAWEKTDICNITTDDLQGLYPNWLTCFEVLEHVEPEHMLRMLEKFKDLTTDDCQYLISTPCWNFVDCADNHVNEMTYEALGAVFEANGFIVKAVYGTFASIRDYEHLLVSSPEGLLNNGVPHHLFNSLRNYYDSNVLSCIFAPLFPANSRNCLWHLEKAFCDKCGGTGALVEDVEGRHDVTEICSKCMHKRLRFKKLNECKTPWGSSTKWKEMNQ